MNIDFNAVRGWLAIIQFAATAAVGAYAWITARQRATEKDLQALRKRVNDRIEGHGDRITRIETNVAHMPTHTDITNLSGRIEALHREIGRMNGTLKGVNRAVDLINEYLLNKDKS